MNITDVIKKRKSTRTFSQSALNPDDRKNLESFITGNCTGLQNENINFKIIEKKNSNNQMKLDYGMIQGHNTYILGASKSSCESRVNYGYLMEKIVLKATEMDISTCWIGIFDKAYFNDFHIENGFEIPGIVIVGYSEERQTLLDKFVRFSVSASKRNSWDKLFFNYSGKTALDPVTVNQYYDSLEMVRIAPSSGNTQPWRVFFDETVNEFHFFKKSIIKKYEFGGLHDIDLGIALSHFELTSIQNGLSGTWFKHDTGNVRSDDELQYIMSWKCG
jgi:hypothetical protein